MTNKLIYYFNNIFNKEFIRYLLVSFFSLIVDLFIFFVCFRVTYDDWFGASVSSFIGGSITNYTLSIFFVFSNRKMRDNIFKECFYFISLGLGGLLINQLIFFIGVELINLEVSFVKLIAIGLGFIFNYATRKYFLF